MDNNAKEKTNEILGQLDNSVDELDIVIKKIKLIVDTGNEELSSSK